MADNKKYFAIWPIRDDAKVLHHAGSVVELSPKRGAALLKLKYVQVAPPEAELVEGKCPEGGCADHGDQKPAKKGK